MINVVLDTNILHQAQNFSSTGMKKLISLSSKKIIQLHIPEVVLNEFTSQKEEECKNLIFEQEKTLNKLSKIAYSRTEYSIISRMSTDFLNIKNSLMKSFNKQVTDFAKMTNLIIIKNDLNDLTFMWNLYFAGELPFKAVKNRADIPDCFIYLAIKKIQAPHVICHDNTLKAALEKDNVSVYESIDDFINKNNAAISSVENTRIRIESHKIEQFLMKRIDTIKKLMIKNLEKNLEYKTFSDESIVSDENEGTIEGTPAIADDDIEIDAENMRNDGHVFFSFNFTCEFQNLVNYFIFKSDYYCIDEEYLEGVSIEDWNEDYFLAEEDMSLKCTGTVTIQVQIEDVPFDEEKYILEEDDISFDDLDLSVL